MKDQRPKLIIITGPTASGKTGLAVEMALNFNGEIINADSMQVYRFMDIGTAKPPVSERKGVPHHMIDVVYPDGEFNASIYRTLTMPVINEISKKRRACFVVGGTGLYIKALLGGLMECPASDHDIREELTDECKEKGPSFLHERLKRVDPESADYIHPNDKTRIIRALEIIRLTNRPRSSFIMEHGFNENPFKTLKICLNISRDQLYKNINIRCDRMIESGLIDETQTLLAKGYSSDIRSMKSLGYRHAVSYLRKEQTAEDMALKFKQDTRRYAKRQLTWFRADREMIWVEPDNREFIKHKIQEFIDR